jgi:hypothetical protein
MLTEEEGGTWYAVELEGQELRGWLCRNLCDYFEAAPPVVYVRGERLGA